MRRIKNYNPESAKNALHRFIQNEETGGEFRAFCPVCEDPDTSTSPSASINFDKNVWYCQSECASAEPAKPKSYWKVDVLIGLLKEEHGFDYRSESMKGRNASVGNPLMTFNVQKKTDSSDKCTDDNVAAWERRLHSAPTFLSQLMDKRGLTVETIKRFRLGWDGSRYTIPVYDSTGTLVNVRRYKLEAGANTHKMLNIPGHGEARLFNIKSLREHDEVVLVEGEMDAMILEQYGIPAVSATAGAATFKATWGPDFTSKTVYICYDNDDGGRQGATKAGKVIAAYADIIRQVHIPLPHKGADVSDFLVLEGHTAEDFKELMAAAQAMNPTRVVEAEEAPSEGRKVSLEDSMSEEFQSEALEMTVTVTGKQNPPYEVPKRFSVTCNMNKGAICEQCPVAWRDGSMDVEIGRDDIRMFDFIGTNSDKLPKLMQRIADARCTDRATYTIEDVHNMEELIVSNSVDERKIFETDKPVSRSVFSVSTHGTPDNAVVRLVGKNVRSPRDQRKSFMAWENDEVQTSLDKFELSDECRKELQHFQVDASDPDNPQSPLDKCYEIARQQANHVTQIYGRDLLHVAYDLVWHSPLAFEVEGKLIEKGWLECMVVGDTRTGKSETAIRLAEHYRSGIVKSCESMSFAGLVGGNQQVGSGSWITTWGVVPLNDRRLVVLDEVSGLKEKDVIENMSSIRSSGVAQITKINTQSTSARTRLIWITNPTDGAMIDERPGLGVDAMRTIVKNQEDIARFDFVMAARASEVDPADINRSHKVRGKHKYPSEMSANLVLWVWSLKPEQIDFTDSAVEEARKIAQSINDEYVADPPLIQAENVRFKLYRIAAALAARTFYIQWPEKDVIQLRVNADHVRDAKRFLDLVYGDSQGMGYRRASRSIIERRKLAVNNRGNARNLLLENPDTILATLKAVAKDAKFRGRDFEEFGGMTRDAGMIAVTSLQKMGMIHRLSQGYIRMDKVLASILREFEEEDY